jgi:hypothetical protein
MTKIKVFFLAKIKLFLVKITVFVTEVESYFLAKIELFGKDNT